MVRHCWPGNIRELQNYIARGVILSNDAQRCRTDDCGKSDLCAWPMRTEFAQSAVSDSAQDVPELVSFCCQIAQRRSGRRNL
jgi:DNA-binding NtrC family response regulator